MKIATISLNVNAPDFNYGAVLHTYAFQQYLKSIKDVDGVEVIDYTMPSLEGQILSNPIYNCIRKGRLKGAIKAILTFGKYRSRYLKFQKFERENLPLTKIKYTQKTLNVASLDYDTVVCESDVIWDPGFSNGQFDKCFFLALKSMENMRKIAYAPSMANGELTEKQEAEIKELLKYPDYISCRESYEKDILSQYTDKKVTHVLDPVFLLDKEEYYKICSEKMLEGHYILLYLPVNDNKKLRDAAKRYAEENNLKILEISTILKFRKDRSTKCICDAGIEEFISSIRYADVIFTNSFHAICFSIIFNKEFYAFSRAYVGKVQDICHVFGLDDRFFPDDNFVAREKLDYSTIDKKVQAMKTKSMQWLNDALYE